MLAAAAACAVLASCSVKLLLQCERLARERAGAQTGVQAGLRVHRPLPHFSTGK